MKFDLSMIKIINLNIILSRPNPSTIHCYLDIIKSIILYMLPVLSTFSGDSVILARFNVWYILFLKCSETIIFKIWVCLCMKTSMFNIANVALIRGYVGYTSLPMMIICLVSSGRELFAACPEFPGEDEYVPLSQNTWNNLKNN